MLILMKSFHYKGCVGGGKGKVPLCKSSLCNANTVPGWILLSYRRNKGSNFS